MQLLMNVMCIWSKVTSRYKAGGLSLSQNSSFLHNLGSMFLGGAAGFLGAP